MAIIKPIKIVFLFAALTCCSTLSWGEINAAKGIYIGGDFTMAGYDSLSGSSFRKKFFTIEGYIRPFVGYRFTDFIAVESSFNYLVNQNTTAGHDYGYGPEGADHYKLYTIDLAAKVIYPFCNGLSIFGKAGAAFAHQDVFNQPFLSGPITADSNANRLLPLVGAGVSYNFTKKWAAEFDFNYMIGMHPIGDIRTIGLGVSYTF